MTFGDFNARLHAGRDIGGEIYGLKHPGVWAKGSITGVIDAERNLSGGGAPMLALFDGKRYPVVFAGGNIDADVYARNSSQQPNGGKIGSVGAHGGIDGLFKAQSAIDEVFAGGDIDAILDAPTVATPRANDPNVVTDYPLPETPASVKADVLADAAAVYAEVLADRDAVFAAKDDLFAAIADLEADVHDDVATARAELAEATEQTAARAAEALEDRRKGVADAFAKLRAAALKKRDAALSEAKSSREGFAKQIAAEADSHGQAVAQANAKKADVIAQFNTAQRAMQAKRTEAIAQADRLEQLRQKIWKERLISLTEYAEEVAKAAKARAEYLRTINGRIQELQNSSNGMDQLRGLRFEMLKDMMGDDGFMQYLADMEQTLWIATWFGNLFASVVPGLNWIMSGYAAGHGKDMWGNKLSNFERALNHLFFLLPFLPPAAKAGAATGKMTAAGAKGLAQYGKRLHAASKAKFAQMAARREAMAGIRQYQKNLIRQRVKGKMPAWVENSLNAKPGVINHNPTLNGFHHVREGMKEPARLYQKQVTGTPHGKAYFKNGVKFDGYKNGVLLEAKGPGYAKLMKHPEVQAKVGNRLLNQAQDQVKAAKGIPIRWIVAEKSFAKALQQMFKNYDIPIKVVYEAMKKSG